MILQSVIAALLAFSPITIDEKEHSVSFTATSTDCGLDTQLEFLFVDPISEHDYESMFVLDCKIDELTAAMRKAGIPSGAPVSSRDCRFWPTGGFVAIEPDVFTVIRDVRNEGKSGIVFTGGSHLADGRLVASTNMPAAFFALYNLDQSPLQFADSLDQSTTYGRFQPAVKIPKGEKRQFKITWHGMQAQPWAAKFEPDNASDILSKLRHGAAACDWDVKCTMSSELTVDEARAIANALAIIDSPHVMINGFDPAQFFYRAFLPLEAWKDRKQRLSQPYEVRLGATNTVTVITEDWSKLDGLDPALSAVEYPLDTFVEPASNKTDTCFIYAQKGTKLSSLYEVKTRFSNRIKNWYIFDL